MFPQHPNCRCTLIPMTSCAEQLLDLANTLMHPRSSLAIAENVDQENFGRVIALYKVGLDLREAGKVIQFRAIMENWDQKRINKELY